MSVLVLAGHRRSLPAILLTSLLTAPEWRGPTLCGVVYVSEFSLGRLGQWYRQYRSRLWSKLWSGLGFSTGNPFDQERDTFLKRLDTAGVPYRNLATLCKERGIPLCGVKALNGTDCLAVVQRLRPDLLIYTGGGILREPLLLLPRLGTLNMHCGPLPHVRGMNGVEWSLFLGLRPTVTLHYIDKGIDTGSILAWRTLEVAQGEPLGGIRARTVLAGIDLVLERLSDVAAEKHPTLLNPTTKGRQYYAMAESLKGVVQTWIDRGLTPLLDPSEADPDDMRPAPVRQITEGRPTVAFGEK